MKEYSLSVPSKTFLAGEYLAMHGGGSILVSTEPRFRLKAVQIPGKKNENPFHPESPAGMLWSENRHQLESFQIEFFDPHQGKGGFGASTAQFLFVCALLGKDQEAYAEYRRLTAKVSGGGRLPSGADLVGQRSGQLTYFNSSADILESFNWPFADLGFCLLGTSHKVPTHEHLRQLRDFDVQGLERAIEISHAALLSKDEGKFIEGISAYGAELHKLNFVAKETLELLHELDDPAVLAKKGCGALGADVVLLLYRKMDQDKIKNLVENRTRGLRWVATDNNICVGQQKNG